MNFKPLLLFLLFLGICLSSYGQNKEQDKDSTNFYNKIEDYSKKGKFTKTLYRLVFEPTKKKQKNPVKEKENRNYQKLNGKIIRNIKIDSKDPFGFSFKDSTEVANSWVEKTGNQVHIKSRRFAIKNFLLLKKNRPLDTLLLDESERLIRSQNFIREVKITAELVSKNSDSVDISIVSLDSWSIIPQLDLSTSKNKLRLKERNLVGLGHQLSFSFTNRLSDGKNAYETEYRVPNFKHTFVSAAVKYKIDLNEYYEKSINIERPFYSPVASWAGGIYMDEQFREDALPDDSLIFRNQNFKYLSKDFWVAHAIKLFAGNTARERTTNLVLGARLLNIDYKVKPRFEYDSINYFANETFYLGSIGISSRQFIKDEFIFKDGVTEDVPVGAIYSLTGGYQRKNQQDRLYLGARISFGNSYSWGYLSTNAEIGSFFHGSETEQTAYSFQLNYFTNLISLGSKWKLRQFAKPQFIVGLNRLNSIADRVTIDQNNSFNGIYGNGYQRSNSGGIPGFDSNIFGTRKFVLALQTQFYSPWEVLGFRLNPYLNFTAATIAEKGDTFGSGKIYSSIGVGFIIRNDYLIFSSFQISLSFYPQIPGQGNNIFQTNSFETEDFGFQKFELAKPRPIWYN